jgi:membrane dipeptidase
MLIFDGDYPMATGALRMERDLTLPIREVRDAPEWKYRQMDWPDAETMATLPEMRRGKVAGALVKVCVCIKKPGHDHGEFRSAETAYAHAMGQLAYYRILEARGEARILANRGDFAEHMRAWEEAEDHADLPVGLVLGMEGADPILWPEQVRDWWDDGLRVISLSHYGVSTYAHGTGTGTTGGLQPGARELLAEMDSLGMVLDVSHTADESIRQSLDLFGGPVLSSHQNCRALVLGERQIPDDLLQTIIGRGAVIGASMDAWMLFRPGIDWAEIPERGDLYSREDITLDDYVDHIDHVCQIAGNSLHAAIGGDTDGQEGRQGAPYGIDTVADYQKVADILAERGYTEDDVANVMYRNWQRFFERWLPDAD